MNKMKKLVYQHYWSLVAFSANAEMTISGGASFGVSSANETKHQATTWLTVLISQTQVKLTMD